MKIGWYQTIGRIEIARYMQFWSVVFLGFVHRMVEIAMKARKQRFGGGAPLGGGRIKHTTRRCHVQKPLAYFSAGVVQ